ncbi:MAG: carbamoyltransferase [Pseudomonadota bacterium]|nr:carbamoyltransferase [Pseudomonadota bacterium]
MNILGISAYYHDSAAALVVDGKIVAAAQQERFSRIKADSEFSSDAILFCLDEAGLDLNQLDYVGFYDKPLLTFNRLIETYIGYAPFGISSFVKSIPIWVKEKVFQKANIISALKKLNRGDIADKQILFGFHHHSHAASAFFPSPFKSAAILIMDGVGEWATTSSALGNSDGVKILKEIRFPHSLGMLYSAFTYYLGFKVNDGEYRVMGLAPYGAPIYTDIIVDKLIDIRPDGTFRLDMSYFNYCTGLTMTNEKFHNLFADQPRDPSAPITEKHMNIAKSIQVVLEEIILKLSESIFEETGNKNLCLAGGVALNCVANGRLLRESPFDNIWIQPASGDAGGALGVAMAVAHAYDDCNRDWTLTETDAMSTAYLGPSFSSEEVVKSLNDVGAVFHKVEETELLETVATKLDAGNVVGWFNGRMEFGPRALGNRSILADPRSPGMQRTLNLKVKYRESFRPFAPVVMEEEAEKYFDLGVKSPYMLLVANISNAIRKEMSEKEKQFVGLDRLSAVSSELPAITHVDNSARVQTVSKLSNPRLYKLLHAFNGKTGCGVLVNTSFNVRDEPIVCSPLDAYQCFMATEMDLLVLEDCLLYKNEQ